VEHYEIATYGGLVQFAITVGQHEAADILDRTLREEEDTDRLLTEIAENDINLGAEQEEIEFSWDRERNQKQEREGQNSRMEETEE
jgi:ferritin-like metal-binding protein YciE